MLRRILFLFALCCASATFAQVKTDVEPCATMKIYNEKLQKKEVETVEQFERWLAQKIYEAKANGNGKQRTIITIPYVVHVINNGEALGTLSNISNTQINDQIGALNRDLRKANPDIANLPSAFQPLAADFEIEFCPAQVDPQGNILGEPGIDRVNRVTQGWTAPPHSDTYIDGTIKPATIWNPSNYFNMWVTELGSGLLGYATFPGTTLLQGLNFPQYVGTATSDGIVVHYPSFGNGNAGLLTNYSKGRVAVHEIGHWLGMRHIWGDSNCGTDYCNDTPTHSGSNFGCPAYPSPSCSNNGDLTHNYMDYTNDDCKLMFSNDQKIRAVTIMNNSPFRLSLQSSSVCSLPGLNVGVTDIVAPCTNGTSQTVTVTIKNKGITAIAAGDVSVNLSVSGGITGSYGAVMNTAAMATNGSTTLTFTNVDLSTTADITLTAIATLVGDLYTPDDTYNLGTNLGDPLITSVITAACPTVPFTINLTNPKLTATSTEWQVSADNITFTPIANVTTNSLTTSLMDTMYYRCKTICGGTTYFSNVLEIDIDAPNNCYCTPTYNYGCSYGGGVDAITNVTVGAMSNPSVCTPSPSYTFYNGLTVPIIDRFQATPFSISFASDPSQYFAIWIDQNADGIFDASEMVAKNTVSAGANGVFTGTINLPSGTYLGQTRMRVRGGDDYALNATQSCGASNSIYGETEDYLVEITALPINVGITTISPPCVSGTNQTVSVTIKNRGLNDIAIGATSVDLSFNGGANGTATALSNTTIIPTNGIETLTFNNLNLTSTGGNVTFDALATLAGDGNLTDNVMSFTTDLDAPNISSTVTMVCSGAAFSITLTNPKTTTTAIQWESSINNINFSAIAGATTSNLNTSQTVTNYYRCKITCGGAFFYSNVLQIDMSPPTNCYCIPSYSSGCGSSGGDAITNVTLDVLSNSSGCTGSPFYNFYNTAVIPQLDKNQSSSYSITFGPDGSQYFAIWIDQNMDGIFAASEMVAQNTVNAGGNGTYTGTFNLLTNATLGQTRMRVRGGDDSQLSATQGCGFSNSSYGETEDYLVEITAPPINVAVNAIATPCIASTSQNVGITIQNKGTDDIPIGNLNIVLNVSGGITGTYSINNTAIITSSSTVTLSVPNVNLSSTADITLEANAIITGDSNLADNTFSLATNLSSPLIAANNNGACSGQYFNLSLTNPRPSFSALQWESSNNNVTFSNIVGATTLSLNTLQTALTYYRCKVTCGGSSFYSNVLQMSMLPVTSCYCVPTYSSGCSFGDAITSVTYATMSNTSSCSTNAAYSYYYNLPVPTILRGTAKTFSISFGSDATNYFAVWIDMNHDGVFATTEMYLNNTTPIGAYGTYTGTITVPLGTYVGQTRMRIRGGDNATLLNTHSCGASNSIYGETEDYIVNLESPCTTPAIGTVSTITDVSARTPLGCIGCTGPYIIEYGVTGFTPGVGTTPGVGGSIFTTPVLNQTLTGLQPGITYDVYARQACSNNSAKKTFTTTCNTTSLPYSDGFNVGVLSSCWQNNVVTAGTVAPTLTVVPSSTFPTTNAPEGTHMIKFNSHFATAGAQSRLVSKALNTTGVNKVDVAFQMYEDNELISAEDKVKVQYSLNGTTWTDIEELVRPNTGLTTGNWYNRTFSLPTAAGNQTTLRIGLLFTSALGNNVYIDNFKVYASPIFPNFNADTCATIVVNNVSGKNNFRFRNANSLVAEINPNGNNLGTVTLLMKENLAGSANVPTSNNGIKYMPRYFDLKSNTATPFPQNATLRFLFHDNELTDLNAATNGNETINTLLVKKYKEPNGGSSSENCITSDNILPSTNVSGVVAMALSEGFMLQVQVNEFGEFGGFPNTVLAPKIRAKVLLSNANVSNGMMLPALNIEPNFPLSDPYSVAPWNSVFTHVAAGPTASTTSTVVNVAGNNAIIDWVFLELRTGFSGSTTVAYTKAALLQADGDIVDMDGTSVVAFPNAIAADYFVAVRHRNHLGFRTDAKIAVSATTPLLDFTNGSQLLYGIAPLVPINATQNVMNGGDANMDGSLDGTDSTVWEIQNGGFDDYLLNTDYNLDGSVDGSDSAIWQLNNGKYQELD